MNKLKRPISELRKYLGRDSRGQELLGRVQRAAVEALKAKQSAEDLAAESAASLSAAKLRADTAEVEAEKLKGELHGATESLESCRRRVADMQSRITAMENGTDSTRLVDQRGRPESPFLDDAKCAAMFNMVKRSYPVPPPVESQLDGGYVFDIENLINDLLPVEFQRLGAIVAMGAVLGWPSPFCVVWKSRPRKRDLGQSRPDGGLIGEQVRWMQKHWLQKSPEGRDQLYAAFPTLDQRFAQQGGGMHTGRIGKR